MAIHTAGLIYFSPTRTTQRIVAAIAQGLPGRGADHGRSTDLRQVTAYLPQTCGGRQEPETFL